MSQRQTRRRDKRRRHAHRRPSKRQLAAGAGIAMGATLAAPAAAHAADFTVTNLNDSGPGSLRQAVADSDTSPGADRVLFASGLSGTITLTSGRIRIGDDVQILGPGADTLTVSGNGSSRIFLSYANTTISALTLAAGNADYGGSFLGNSGGAIFSYDALTITESVLTGNTASNAGGQDGAGGAIIVYQGSLTVESSTISGNTAESYGGAVYFDDSDDNAQSVIRNSTLAGNSVNGDGGAVYPNDQETQGPILIQNSTITGNHAGDNSSDHGGGVYDFSDPPVITIDSSTVTGNSAVKGGGGIFFQFGDTVRNSIISGNTVVEGGSTYGPDIGSRPNGLAFNTAFDLIGNPAGPAINETVPGSNILGADPQLGPLADNGGLTQTMALPASSPAVDAGSAFGLSSDQRGVLRPIDLSIANSSAAGADGSDIGAFELQPSNAIKLGKLKKNKRKGTAKQTVLVPLPDAGTVTISGKGLKKKTKQVADSGKVKLRVIPKGKKRRKVRHTGKVKVKEKITYKPTGAESKTLKKRVKLIKRLRARQ